MKRLDLFILAVLAPLFAAVAADAARALRPDVPALSAGGTVSATGPSRAVSRRVRARAHPVTSAVSTGSVDEPAEDVRTVREQIRRRQAGTYIGEILLGRDSALARWPDRDLDPLRVWVASAEQLEDWDPANPSRVRDAFAEWARVGIPMRFTFVVDSADADIHVTWTDRFQESISGKTLWSRDRKWWIVGANITLALHHKNGDALDGSAIRAIALHETGHLLGLDHTSDSANIMTARVRVRELSPADKATLRLVYSVPPGSIK